MILFQIIKGGAKENSFPEFIGRGYGKLVGVSDLWAKNQAWNFLNT
jgi:hypothetical protein